MVFDKRSDECLEFAQNVKERMFWMDTFEKIGLDVGWDWAKDYHILKREKDIKHKHYPELVRISYLKGRLKMSNQDKDSNLKRYLKDKNMLNEV